MKNLWRNKILVISFIIFFLLFPTVISLPQQNRMENIATAIGVDKVEEGYEVSLQYVAPSEEDNGKKLKLAAGKGENIGKAMMSMTLKLGKTSGLAHCRAIIINEDACGENLTEILDGFLRIKTNTNNIILILTSSSAKDLLEASTDLDSDLYTILSTNTIINNKRHFLDFKSVGNYYNSYFGESRCIALNKIDKEDSKTEKNKKETNGKEEEKDGKIINNGEVDILRNGKIIKKLNSQESDNLSFFNKKIKQHKLLIKNFTDEKFSSADIYFDIDNKSLYKNVYFDGKTPVFNLKLVVSLREIQIANTPLNRENYNEKENIFSEKLLGTIKDEIIKKLISAENDFKTNKYDVIDCYDTFHRFCPKKFRNYLDNLKEDEYFLNNIKFNYEVIIKQHL